MSSFLSMRLAEAVRQNRSLREEAQLLTASMQRSFFHSRDLRAERQQIGTEWVCYLENMEALRLGVHRALGTRAREEPAR